MAFVSFPKLLFQKIKPKPTEQKYCMRTYLFPFFYIIESYACKQRFNLYIKPVKERHTGL